MVFLATTYKTLNGVKEIIEVPKKTYAKWIIYQDDKPAFYVDFYDLEKESNAMMNSLVLCTQKKIDEVLTLISKKNNVRLSIPKASFFSFKVKSEKRELNLQPIPKEWLAYSL